MIYGYWINLQVTACTMPMHLLLAKFLWFIGYCYHYVYQVQMYGTNCWHPFRHWNYINYNPMRNTLGHFLYFVLNARALRHMWQYYTLCQSSRIAKYFIPSDLGLIMSAIFATKFYLSILRKGSGGRCCMHEKCPNNFAPDCRSSYPFFCLDSHTHPLPLPFPNNSYNVWKIQFCNPRLRGFWFTLHSVHPPPICWHSVKMMNDSPIEWLVAWLT